MVASEFNLSALPEWYRIERETEKTINKLGSVKELDYYLSNPDEYIRRLAIIRLQKIASKESVYALKEILDNAVESNENKYLAAWTLKTAFSGKDSDLFISSKYLGKFTGNERYRDLFLITEEDSAPSVKLDFSSSESFSSLKLESDETALERDAFFETSFDIKQWYSRFILNIRKSILKGFNSTGAFLLFVPAMIGKAFSAFIKKLSHIGSNKGKGQAKAARKNFGNHTDPVSGITTEQGLPVRFDRTFDYTGLRREIVKKPGILSLIKKGGFQVLYFLFAPFRLLRRHKLAILCMLAAVYLLLAYTEYGRAFTNKYMAFDMRNAPVLIINKAQECSAYVLTGLNKLTGLDEYKKQNLQAASSDKEEVSGNNPDKSSKEGKRFSVMAQNGLNMRKSPDPGSEKVGTGPLPYGSTVVYLSKSENDNAGRTWYYVEAVDGRSGWVSARFLKEKKEG